MNIDKNLLETMAGKGSEVGGRFEELRAILDRVELSGKVDRERIRWAIATVGLDPDSKKHVGKYSLGMRQRLGLAQAMMEDPELLILDEPMNGLDKGGVAEMRELFLKLKEQGKTILIASHNPDDTRILCDTLHEMDAGVMTERAVLE